MKSEVRQERIKLLAEIDDIEQGCNGCATRAHFNTLKDATGLSQYGDKLLKLL